MSQKLTGSLPWILLFLVSMQADAAYSLPKTLGYSFFVQGAPAGRTDLKITQDSKQIVFESETRVMTGTDVIALVSRTVADPKTYEVRDFTYSGSKGDHAVSCHAQVAGDSVYGFIEMDGALRDKHLAMPNPRNLLFEDWLMEHEILLALTQAASARQTDVYGLVFTSSFSPAEITAGFSGEVLVEAGPRSMVARKLVVIIRGAEPFESHIDPVRGVPVYIRFPGSRTEIFLDEVFGENPVTYYTSSEKAK